MQFHVGVREILKRATQLALARGAESVGTVHLLECGSDLEPVDPITERDIPFHSDALEILSLAAEHAGYDESPFVRRGHLELALLIRAGRLPPWSESGPSNFHRSLLLIARDASHIRRAEILSLLKEVAAMEFDPEEVQLSGAKFARFQEHARGAKGMSALPVLVLLAYALAGGPIGEMLRRHGLDEAALAEALHGRRKAVIQAVPVARPASEPKQPDFTPCLGAGFERLTLESRKALALAWVLRDGDELTGRDLLRALIACSNQLEEDNVHSLLDGLRPEAGFAQRLVNDGVNNKLVTPTLSAEVYRTVDFAMREAGPDRQVSSFDLLIGLAECAQELLAQEGITAAEIRQRSP